MNEKKNTLSQIATKIFESIQEKERQRGIYKASRKRQTSKTQREKIMRDVLTRLQNQIL